MYPLRSLSASSLLLRRPPSPPLFPYTTPSDLEYLIGVEREVAPALVVSARFNYRKLGRVIEDFLVPSSGEYFIANPAEGRSEELTSELQSHHDLVCRLLLEKKKHYYQTSRTKL